jgi:hypothetical protein
VGSRRCSVVGGLLRRQPAGPGEGTTVRRFLTSRASAPAVTLRAVLRGPTVLASTAVHAGTLMPVKPARTDETAAATRGGSRGAAYRHCHLAHSGTVGRIGHTARTGRPCCLPPQARRPLLAVFTLGCSPSPRRPTPAPASNALPRPRLGPIKWAPSGSSPPMSACAASVPTAAMDGRRPMRLTTASAGAAPVLTSPPPTTTCA